MCQSHHKHDRNSTAGFTLVEALIALAIASLGLQVALDIISTHSARRAEAIQRRLAVSYAESVLAQIGISTELREGTDDGSFDNSMLWHQSITRSPASQVAGLIVVPYVVTIEVSWIGGTQRRTVNLKTIKLGQGAP